LDIDKAEIDQTPSRAHSSSPTNEVRMKISKRLILMYYDPMICQAHARLPAWDE
jgi:hypothetical protein